MRSPPDERSTANQPCHRKWPFRTPIIVVCKLQNERIGIGSQCYTDLKLDTNWKTVKMLQIILIVSALVNSQVSAQGANSLVANWLAKETTDFERAELMRNNEQVALGCEEEKITIKCSNRFTRMEVVKTFYGRDDKVTCPNPVLDTTTLCEEPANDVAKKVVDLCHGENKCKIPVNVDFLGHNGSEICPGIRKYLRIVYKCTQHPKIRQECPKNCSKSCWPLCKESCCNPPPPSTTPPPTTAPPTPPPSPPPAGLAQQQYQQPQSYDMQSGQQQQMQPKYGGEQQAPAPSKFISPALTFSGRTGNEQKSYPPCPLPCSEKCAPLCLLSCCNPIPRPPTRVELPALPAAQIPKGFACPAPCSQKCIPACTVECCRENAQGGASSMVTTQQAATRRSQGQFNVGYMAPSDGNNFDKQQQYDEAKAAWNYRSKIWRQKMNALRQQQQQQRAAKKATIASGYWQPYPRAMTQQQQHMQQLYARNRIPDFAYGGNIYG